MQQLVLKNILGKFQVNIKRLCKIVVTVVDEVPFHPHFCNYCHNLLSSGNGFVILAVVINKKLRSATNALIVSLAFADLPVGVIIFPLISITQIYGPSLQYGRQLCHTTIFLTEVFLSASCLHLLFISVDRYIGETNMDEQDLYLCVAL